MTPWVAVVLVSLACGSAIGGPRGIEPLPPDVLEVVAGDPARLESEVGDVGEAEPDSVNPDDVPADATGGRQDSAINDTPAVAGVFEWPSYADPDGVAQCTPCRDLRPYCRKGFLQLLCLGDTECPLGANSVKELAAVDAVCTQFAADAIEVNFQEEYITAVFGYGWCENCGATRFQWGAACSESAGAAVSEYALVRFDTHCLHPLEPPNGKADSEIMYVRVPRSCGPGVLTAASVISRPGELTDEQVEQCGEWPLAPSEPMPGGG